MAQIQWDQALFGVGIAKIDEQHKMLVKYINALDTAMSSAQDKDVLGKTLANIINYTEIHFRFEEDLMKNNQFPEFNSHKKIHDEFVEKVKDLHLQFHNGSAAISDATMVLIRDWLVKHIGGSDKKYGAYLNKKGIK